MFANVDRNVNPSQLVYDVPGICEYTKWESLYHQTDN